MSARKSVLGVLGVCWVDFATLHSAKPRPARVLDGCVRCVRFARVRACVRKKNSITLPVDSKLSFFSTRGPEKPYTPYTPYTDALKALILKGSECVGFVLGCGILCWVAVLGGESAR